MKPVTLVSATRGASLDEKALGKSLRRIPDVVKTKFVTNNTDGLSKVYNRFLTAEYKDDILLFVHDDVFLEDYYVAHRLNEAMEKFDVVGIAGQTNWPPDAVWDDGQNGVCISKWNAGALTMGDEPLTSTCLWFSREPEQACVMVDGLLIAMNTQRVLEVGATFDEQFAFGIYDLDFSRTCVQKGLRVGVWPLVVTHQSNGNVVGSELWFKEMALYKEKWGNR
jgi:GT2 family glycosyltransferase